MSHDIDYGSGWLSEEYCRRLEQHYRRQRRHGRQAPVLTPVGFDEFDALFSNGTRHRYAVVRHIDSLLHDDAELRYHPGYYRAEPRPDPSCHIEFTFEHVPGATT